MNAYLWGLESHYQGAIPLEGAIIYYENRDTLDHLAYEVYPDPDAIADLLARVKAMEWQRSQPKTIPDQVLADIIAKRIVAKHGAEAITA